jgi:hypothetical protein
MIYLLQLWSLNHSGQAPTHLEWMLTGSSPDSA